MNQTKINDLYSEFDDFLNESYPNINIAGIEFDAAYVLQKMDPIAYETTFYDWVDSLGIDLDEPDEDEEDEIEDEIE